MRRWQPVPVIFAVLVMSFSSDVAGYLLHHVGSVPSSLRSASRATLCPNIASSVSVNHKFARMQKRDAMSSLRCSGSEGRSPVVALTRELGKNDKLGKLLAAKGFRTEEIPCIAFEEGPDCPKLPAALAEGKWEYVVVTSPEAADVFLKGWNSAGQPKVTVASVGTATEAALKSGGVQPVFVPSKALGKVLAKELPGPNDNGKVLYPSSCKAQTEVQGGLGERGFEVTRLDTYDTVSATWTEEQENLARQADIVTLASPSAVKTWAARVGTSQAAACIGETSAKACKEAGFKTVFWPPSPGMDGWVQACEDARNSLK